MTAAPGPRTPVIVGVGQVIDRGDDSPEPVELLAEAARVALADSGSHGLASAIDSIRVVRLLSWRYRDPGALVAASIGAKPRHTAYTTDGGQTPQSLLNRTAADIQAGRTDVVVLGGAESWRTRMAHRKRGSRPDWTKQPDDSAPAEVFGSELDMTNEIETALDIIRPVQVYPMFESALRYAAGRSIDDHTAHIGALWSRLSAVGATNPYAALPRELSGDEIATPSASNRLIGFPYTKLLCSNNSVNQAAALIICSFERARSLGVSADRMVFPLSGAEAHDTQYVSNRRDLHSSPAIRVAGRAALELAGASAGDLAHVDLYSCFPSAVEVAAAELGLDIERQLTVTGGLTFAGGPWNNYVSHSIATMVDLLREDASSVGLCSGNGGLLTKHAFGVYSTQPPSDGFRATSPEVDGVALREVADGDVTGPAVVEAYTVMHDGEGRPEIALMTALLPDGRRTWRTCREGEVIAAMTKQELCGQPVDLRAGGEISVA
jgi:acetyl-CoA C-acetyltransferase